MHHHETISVDTWQADGLLLDVLLALAEGYDEGWIARQLGNPNPATRALPSFTGDAAEAHSIGDREGIEVSPVVNDQGAITGWSARKTFGGASPVSFFEDTAPLARLRCHVVTRLGTEYGMDADLHAAVTATER